MPGKSCLPRHKLLCNLRRFGPARWGIHGIYEEGPPRKENGIRCAIQCAMNPIRSSDNQSFVLQHPAGFLMRLAKVPS